jgi:hypothetical protein
MGLTGQSFLGSQRGALSGAPIQALNPSTGQRLDPVYASASAAEANRAVELAAQAFPVYAAASGKVKGAFLRRIADGLDGLQPQLAERAHQETALPMPRLLGEVSRTSGQLRLFASVIEEGSWVEARIDPALPERKPMARPGLRSVLRPLGPVVVFGASNFPLAFSAAGGDTASALAAGCHRQGSLGSSRNQRTGGHGDSKSGRRGGFAGGRLLAALRLWRGDWRTAGAPSSGASGHLYRFAGRGAQDYGYGRRPAAADSLLHRNVQRQSLLHPARRAPQGR